MHRRLTTVCLFACLALSCRRESTEDLGLRRTPRRRVDVRALERVSELVSALRRPGEELDAQLGARHQVLSSTIKVEPQGRLPDVLPEVLEERFVIDVEGASGVHLVHDSGSKDGFEATFVDGALYVRPRFGKFVRRRPEGDEVERLRGLVEGVPAASIELVAPFLSVRDAGEGRLLGRATKRLTLSLKDAGIPGKEEEPGRKWRETLKVYALDGELEVDAASGGALALRLDIRYQFDRPSSPNPVPNPVKVESSLRLVTSLPEAVIAPDDFVATPHRSRPILDRNFLLDGLIQR